MEKNQTGQSVAMKKKKKKETSIAPERNQRIRVQK